MSIVEGNNFRAGSKVVSGDHLISFCCILEKACRENLLKNVKKEVKQLMEVSVTRKVIHEDNSRITSLCGELFCWLDS